MLNVDVDLKRELESLLADAFVDRRSRRANAQLRINGPRERRPFLTDHPPFHASRLGARASLDIPGASMFPRRRDALATGGCMPPKVAHGGRLGTQS